MIKGDITNKSYYKYAIDAIDGKIVVGNTIKLACKRFINDLDRDDLVFDVSQVDYVIDFISIFKHNTGKFAGEHFILLDWQKWVVANIYGFYWLDGSRRFSTVYIEIARKCGKSTLAAALGLYALMGEGEPAAQVITAANSKDQAKILLTAAKDLAKSADPKKKTLIPYRNEIKYPKTDSFLKVVSADTSKLDGLNCSTFIIDEYHEAKDTKMWDVLKSSQGMRTNGLGIIITTSGFDKTGPCYAKRNVGIEILNGLKVEDTFFCAIYTIDEEDDWTDEDVWVKSCPCLDVTVTKKYMREQINSAKNNPSEEVGVKTKNLNVWCDSSQTWLPDSYIINSSSRLDLRSLGEGLSCYVGVDLAATSDLTAVSYLVVKDSKYYFKTHYYLPSAALTEKSDKELYKLWNRLGLLTITPGNVTDYDYITRDIMEYSEILNIQSIGYDKYNATQWAIDATEKGLPLEEYPQTLCNFNRPTRELERLILSNKVVLDDSEITRFCFRNVVLKSDYNGNVKPSKYIDKKKIDGVIAIIQALGCFLNTTRYSNEIISI